MSKSFGRTWLDYSSVLDGLAVWLDSFPLLMDEIVLVVVRTSQHSPFVALGTMVRKTGTDSSIVIYIPSRNPAKHDHEAAKRAHFDDEFSHCRPLEPRSAFLVSHPCMSLSPPCMSLSEKVSYYYSFHSMAFSLWRCDGKRGIV
jgi:hypothetical protein